MGQRCSWADSSPEMRIYHDTEWGKPSHDDAHLFELLILEGAQAGLSWATILSRRDGYHQAFRAFDVQAVAAMTDDELAALLTDPGIIRNRLKVFGARKNAQAFLRVSKEFGSFDTYLWGWVSGETIVRSADDQIWRTTSPLSDAISKDLKKRGFTFVGSTIMYAYLQAVGVINDHVFGCPAR